MTTRLKVYNGALRRIGDRQLASLNENSESRRVLDEIWDDGFVNSVLEMGYWRFATRTVRIEKDPNVSPSFGYRNAFLEPEDYLRTCEISADEYFNTPLLAYQNEGPYIFTDIEPIYLRYVSNGAAYGGDLSRWTESFTQFVEAQMALLACERLTQNATKEEKLERTVRQLLANARSKDAMEGPTKFMPPGRWSGAREGGHGGGGRRDWGNRGRLRG